MVYLSIDQIQDQLRIHAKEYWKDSNKEKV